MDSMRTLNTSLPRSPRREKSSQPPEQLIQTFKTAALSVTNLYKTAAADQKIAREAGYQDALDDLLAFLDREHIGLDDGEGWRIRQWATGRLDSSPPVTAASDDEEERVEVAKGVESSPLGGQRVTDRDQPQQSSRSTSPVQLAAAAVARTLPSTMSLTVNMQTQNEHFTFRSAQSLPQDIDVQLSDNTEVNRASSPPQVPAISTPAVRVGVVPRGSRASHRSGRSNPRATTSVRLPTSITGSKRKIPFPDYFDIGSLGDSKEGQGGGGKKGRFV